ncbi:procathepsin L-like [Leguminivora glycinivorella]|uniref:procathepsin L-like n=1 Tax=Leguminivora glycinivorella TaxID=1035111 RepID=UPI00200D1408|nr:procathepsin L-like [Leguminivora glycinivorella]
MYTFLIIVLNLSLIRSELHLNETVYKIKYLLQNRHKKCIDSNTDDFLNKAISFFHKTDNYGEFLKTVNVSGCGDGEYSASYVKEHIVDGLLTNHNVPESHWHEYKAVYNKEFESPHHETAALQKWRQNLRRVASHNQGYVSGKHSYSVHLNHFGDLAPVEYAAKILKLKETPHLFDPAHDPFRRDFHKHIHKRAPRQVDWRAAGFKPAREQQYKCGACYAFAVAHALQAQLYKRHGDWSELSPQQIIDCSYPDGNEGCDGGSLNAAMRYVAREGLIMEKFYPYKGKKGRCHYSRLLVRARPRRWALLPPGDEDAMELALAAIGPLAVAVNAAPFTFQLYKGGVYDDLFCTPWHLNHAMLLVGYTQEYWILLNWWGKNWGEDGYMRIRRGFNRCGVANMAAYVQL